MFQRDYILRMIEMAAQAIARAMRLLVDKKPEEAEEQLNSGYAALAIDRELLLLLDAVTLRGQLDDDRLHMAVRLLLCDAQLQVHKGKPQQARRALKAARRLLEVPGAPPIPDDLRDELTSVTRVVEAA